MPPLTSLTAKPALPGSRSEELENSRLGVIYFLGNLRVDFSPEQSATDLKNKGLELAQSKVGGTKLGDKALTVGKKVGGVVEAIDKTVDEIALTIQEMAGRQVQHVADRRGAGRPAPSPQPAAADLWYSGRVAEKRRRLWPGRRGERPLHRHHEDHRVLQSQPHRQGRGRWNRGIPISSRLRSSDPSARVPSSDWQRRRWLARRQHWRRSPRVPA